MRIAILSDGRPGHYNQSLGIAKIISEERDTAVTIIESKLKLNSFRSVLRLYQRSLIKNFITKNAQKIMNMT